MEQVRGLMERVRRYAVIGKLGMMEQVSRYDGGKYVFIEVVTGYKQR